MYGVTEFVVNSHPVAQPSAISVKDPDRWATMFDTDRKTSAGVSVNHRTTIGYPPFWRGVNLLANGVGGLPVDVYRRTGDDRRVANTHPASGRQLIHQHIRKSGFGDTLHGSVVVSE